MKKTSILTLLAVLAMPALVFGAGNVTPSSTSAKDLGTAALRWRRIYIDELRVSTNSFTIDTASFMVTNRIVDHVILGVTGSEGKEGRVDIIADDGDDADDNARIAMTIGGNLEFRGTDFTNVIAILDMSTGNYNIDGFSEVGSLGDSGLASSLDATNLSTLVMEGLIVQMNANGQPITVTTNAVTLASIPDAQSPAVFYVVNVGSNNLSIAQTGTFKSPALVLAPFEPTTIIAVASNAFYAVDSD